MKKSANVTLSPISKSDIEFLYELLNERNDDNVSNKINSDEDFFLQENIINEATFDLSTSKSILQENPFSGYLSGIPGGVGVIFEEYGIVKELLDNPVSIQLPISGFGSDE